MDPFFVDHSEFRDLLDNDASLRASEPPSLATRGMFDEIPHQLRPNTDKESRIKYNVGNCALLLRRLPEGKRPVARSHSDPAKDTIIINACESSS
ncbi:hypothetical protein CISG_04831 [Coccidioides immitis RMSCC 3703]|uniref:Uncharacterized protein n=1 Tax=Coccidioides immitis RMSCC 3703 TaxID=454286 RepID=A0A0J8TPL9_COCIT|nr:hypothetical protein CISG_04831 [Coccidioides immitis RMSCC 3703]